MSPNVVGLFPKSQHLVKTSASPQEKSKSNEFAGMIFINKQRLWTRNKIKEEEDREVFSIFFFSWLVSIILHWNSRRWKLLGLWAQTAHQSWDLKVCRVRTNLEKLSPSHINTSKAWFTKVFVCLRTCINLISEIKCASWANFILHLWSFCKTLI